MWKVRIEQHEGLRQLWRSLLRFARNWRQPVPDCISVGRKMCNVRANDPLLQQPKHSGRCTNLHNLTNGWRYCVDIDGAEFRPNPSRSMESARRTDWLHYVRHVLGPIDACSTAFWIESLRWIAWYLKNGSVVDSWSRRDGWTLFRHKASFF
jgi:hypothetical protein